MVIKKVGLLSFGRINGLIYSIIGLLAGACVSLASLVGRAVGNHNGDASPGILLGIGAVIFLPILYGIGGFVLSVIGAWIYNVMASLVGGIEIVVE